MKITRWLLIKSIVLLLVLIAVYTAFSISRLPPIPLAMFSSIFIVVGYVLLSFNIIWITSIEWKHIVVFIVLAGASSLIGLLDCSSLFIVLTILLLLILCRISEVYGENKINELLFNKYVILLIAIYYAIALTMLLLRFAPMLPETLGLGEVRMILSVILASKIFYLLTSLFIIAAIYALYRDIILVSGSVELRRNLIRELVEVYQNLSTGRDPYYMFIIETMLLIVGVLVYPIMLYVLVQVKLIVSGLIYIIGIVLTYTVWVILRILSYKLFSIRHLSISEVKKTLLYIWVPIIIIIILMFLNPSTTTIITSMVGYRSSTSPVSLFNKFYKSIVDLEFNAVKLLVELLWG